MKETLFLPLFAGFHHAARNKVSQLIYPAVWLTFCRGLLLAGSELHGNLYFFYVLMPGSFLSTLYLGQYSLLQNEKQTITWLFWYKKKLKRTGVSSILAATSLPNFQAFFAFEPLPFLHIPEDSRMSSASESKKQFVIYNLSICCVPAYP